MAAKKKYKRLTNKEKQLNKEVREEMRAEGILPPVKARLNRSKFSKEVVEEFTGSFGLYTDLEYLSKAISYMIPFEKERHITSEQIGVVKLLKLAMEIKKYIEEKIAQGETKYSPLEMYKEVVHPVLRL
ncbi:MAG TPA: addiction module toxin RelE [Syntrophomonadaceae bacterium]|nr:addiction module toxin RelE [Syntrophomonadaceae bacterium]